MGLSAARACAIEGARLILVGRDSEKCQQVQSLIGKQAQSLCGDAADPATADRAVDMAIQQAGRLDGWYHVAGGSGRRAGDGPLDQISDEGWEFTLHTNLTSLLVSNRAAVRQMLAQEHGGSVVNMSSVLGFAPSASHFATHAYAAAKAGAIGLTRAAAAYYAPHKIRFNVIAPALIATPMAERALADESTMDYVRFRQPLGGDGVGRSGGVGRPEDVDQAAVFFLSDDSRFVTGQVMAVDGGWSVSG